MGRLPLPSLLTILCNDRDLPGNDGSWAQIERGQVAMFGSDTACLLNKETPYHGAAEQFGAVGLCIPEGASREDIESTLKLAQVGWAPLDY